MTEFSEAGQGPRTDVWRLAGAAALTGEQNADFVRRLYGLAGQFGLVVQQVVTEPTEAHAGPSGRRTAEASPLPTVLRKDEMLQYARARNSDSTQKPETYTIGTWNALLRLVDNVKSAKGEINLRRSQAPAQNAFFGTLSITFGPDIGDKREGETIDLASLYDTLSTVLPDGISKARTLPSLGIERLDFLAGIVNDRLRLEIPLPRRGEKVSNMAPLPPRYPRAVNVQSPYLRRVGATNQEGSNEERTAIIVSSDELRKFAGDLGVSPSATEQFLDTFEGIVDYFGEWPSTPPTLRSPQWVNENLYFVKNRRPREGKPYPVWGIRLEAFIDKLYELESDATMYGRIPYGLQIRKFARRYLETVAPHTPDAE